MGERRLFTINKQDVLSMLPCFIHQFFMLGSIGTRCWYLVIAPAKNFMSAASDVQFTGDLPVPNA